MTFNSFPDKEARMTDVKIEALSAMVSKAHDGVHLTHSTANVMDCCLCTGQPVQHGKPDQALGLLPHPVEPDPGLDAETRLSRVKGEAAPHPGLDVGSSELGDLPQVAGYHHQVV